MKWLVILPTLVIAGCQTAQPIGENLAPVVRANYQPNKADTFVAKRAAELARSCRQLQAGTALLSFGLSTATLFSNSVNIKRAQEIVSDAKAATDLYCAGPPPADVAEALQKIAQIYLLVLSETK